MSDEVEGGRRPIEAVSGDDIESVKVRIAGEIVASRRPGVVMKKWRLLFGEKQKEVAQRMGVTPSVLSDYEQGKRSPGIKFVRRYVESLISLDLERGGANVKHFSTHAHTRHKAILDMREFPTPVPLSRLVEAIEGEYIWSIKGRDPEVFGYTVVNSLAAIRYMNTDEFIQIFGATSMRLLIFSNVSTGRSPLVAVRVYPLKPVAVALHGPASPAQVDRLAADLAELSQIPLILSKSPSVKDLIEALRRIE